MNRDILNNTNLDHSTLIYHALINRVVNFDRANLYSHKKETKLGDDWT